MTSLPPRFSAISCVAMSNDLRRWQELLVTPRVVAMGVCINDVPDRLVGQGFHLGLNIIKISFELHVHQDHTFISQIDRRITALPPENVQIIGDLFELRRDWRRWILPVDNSDAGDKKTRSQ